MQRLSIALVALLLARQPTSCSGSRRLSLLLLLSWLSHFCAQGVFGGILPEGVLVSLPELQGHTGVVTAVSFSPDGETLATGGSDGTVRLWAVDTGTLKMVLRGQPRVSSLSFSPDGSTVASGDADGVVRVWTIGNGALKHTLDGGGSVSISPDGKTLAAAQGTKIQLWDVDAETRRLTLEGGTNRNEDDSISEREVFTSVSFSPDGSTLVSGSYYGGGGWVVCCGLVTLWDVRTGTRKDILHHWLYVASVAFSPDGSVLAIDGQESCDDARIFCPWSVQLRDVATGALLGSSGGTAFSPDGTLLAGGNYVDDQFVVGLWDVATGALQTTLEGHTDRVLSVSFSPDGHTLASASADSTVRLWSLHTETLRTTLESSGWGSVRSISVSPDGRTLASASDRTVRLWDLATGTLWTTLEGHTGEVQSVSFSPDGRTLASADGERVQVWDLGGSVPFEGTRWDGHGPVSFSPDGKTLVSASDQTVLLWEVATGTLRTTLEHETQAPKGGMSVAFSPDGRVLATARCCGTIRLWDVDTGTLRTHLQAHSSGIPSVTFSPDGRTLASGSYDGTVGLWDVATGTLKNDLRHGDASPISVSFSPDGSTLASGTQDWTVWLWDVETGTPRTTLKGHTGWVNVVAFLPDGNTLASGSTDGMVFLWDMSPYMTPTAVSTHGQSFVGPSAQAMLLPNYPNPFNLQTSIPFQLHQAFPQVRLNIYDARGALVRAFDLGSRPAGLHRAVWDGRDQLGKHVASGVYMSRLQAATVLEDRKMLLAK